MKKTLAILLSVVLVLAYASVASAEFAASGKIEVKGVYGASGWNFNGLSVAEMKLKLSNKWGDAASGDVTVKLAMDPALMGVTAGVDGILNTADDVFVSILASKIDTANFNYVLSDAFTLGYVYAADKTKYYSNNALKDDVKTADQNLIKALVALGDGTLTAYYDASLTVPQIYGNLSYPLSDALSLVAAVGYEPAITVIGDVKYMLSDEFSISGGVKYLAAGEIDVAAKAAYKVTDEVEANAKLQYRVDTGALYYLLDGKYFITPGVFNIYGKYGSDPADIKVGSEQIMGKDTKLSEEYKLSDGTLTVKLALAF